jgi:S1-C subfamily serine protease
MKRMMVACGLSVIVGVVLGWNWRELPSPESRSVAQEFSQPGGMPAAANPPAWRGQGTAIRFPANPAVAGGAAPAAAPLPQGVPLPQEGFGGPGGNEDLTPEERINVAVYEMANRSVVNITTEAVRHDLFLAEVRAEGEGSGIVLDNQGHILTNFHVVEGARAIQVNLFTANGYEAKLVGADPISDVAVLKIEAPPEDLVPLAMGDSSRLRVGQRVFAIGNPFGLERTLSTGIISNLDQTLPNPRTNRTVKQMIQIDASINPGNSGGPLLDSHGRMIGVNMAIASKTGESAGVGFAIPVSVVARVVPHLIQTGRVARADIGILTGLWKGQGMLIAKMVPGGAAERAGLRGEAVHQKRLGPIVLVMPDRSKADLIVAVDGKKLVDRRDLQAIIDSKQPGEKIVVSIIREGQKLDVPLVLERAE